MLFILIGLGFLISLLYSGVFYNNLFLPRSDLKRRIVKKEQEVRILASFLFCILKVDLYTPFALVK